VDLLQLMFWVSVALALAQDIIWITVVVAAGLIVWRSVRRLPIAPNLQAAINVLVVAMAAVLLVDLLSPLAGPESVLRR
jgi:hypothetical protein